VTALENVEEQIRECMADMMHLERHLSMYKEIAEGQQAEGRRGHPEWDVAIANVSAYEKALHELGALYAHLRLERERLWHAH
jgi:hypothetical protein